MRATNLIFSENSTALSKLLTIFEEQLCCHEESKFQIKQNLQLHPIHLLCDYSSYSSIVGIAMVPVKFATTPTYSVRFVLELMVGNIRGVCFCFFLNEYQEKKKKVYSFLWVGDRTPKRILCIYVLMKKGSNSIWLGQFGHNTVVRYLIN